MSWGFLGPLRFKTRRGNSVTVFGAWFVAPALLALWLNTPLIPSSPEQEPEQESDVSGVGKSSELLRGDDENFS
jgi:hypothetical protein